MGNQSKRRPPDLPELGGSDPERALGQRMRVLREEAGITQAQLAERMAGRGFPMHQTTIAKIEAGQRPVRVNEAHQLAAILGLRMPDLLADPHLDPELSAIGEELRQATARKLELEAARTGLQARGAQVRAELSATVQAWASADKAERDLRVRYQRARGSMVSDSGQESADSPVADGRGHDLADYSETSAEETEDRAVLQQVLLQLIAGAPVSLGSQFLGAVDRIRHQMDDALFRSSVSPAMLDHWEATSAGYGKQYMKVPPLRLLCDVLLDFGDVRRMCDQRQPMRLAERLCRLAAQFAALAGMTTIDVGDQRMARSFFRTARIAADETHDRPLQAWVTVREALIPLYYGDPQEAMSLAQTAADLAGRSKCAAAVMAPVIEARALGRMATGGKQGTLGQIRQSLDRAAAELAALPESQREDTAFGYTKRQFLFHKGDALVSLGDYQDAEESFRESLQLYPPSELLDRALIMLGLARCKLAADEPEEALRMSRETMLDLPREHRTGILMHDARAIGESVAAQHGESLHAVHEYQEILLSG